ncbi:hypothetical protein K8374_21265 [Pseudomonas sp. p1(2021b)]|uniref:hypothetical protein n=1 Tax=Pseudomonas sp. p1(2021b) TaxID=2874628 RepID=UPI001CD0012A|nr:hypothetical protein [Pseudomonas sp. p1(2021b)]UBM24855.1 hypothetical protein K8374_21265 [Pseudomonas sp. p1(2021b)]
MTDVYVAVLGVFLFASPVVLFTVWVVIANRSLDHIESFFSNSPMVVENRRVFSQAGVLGRIVRVGSVSAMLMAAKMCVHKGLLDFEDVRRFPVRLKRFLVALWFFHLSLFFILVTFCIWIIHWR